MVVNTLKRGLNREMRVLLEWTRVLCSEGRAGALAGVATGVAADAVARAAAEVVAGAATAVLAVVVACGVA
jgi:hypothetical protein